MPSLPLDRRAFGFSSLAFAALGARAASAAGAAPVASTRTGKVRGFRRNGAEIFLGIPYGAPTDGALRFMPPAAPSSWTGVRDATRLGQRAPQVGAPLYKDPSIGQYMAGGRAEELIALNEPMGEDCLVLNVLTPKADPKSETRGRPVLVYLHGGGLVAGSGAVHTLGDRFATEENVVLVTVNHRLSTLGLLYLGGLSPAFAEGNPGILDMVAALRWVRDNIAEFGGDPSKVTIFGESGGGVKVALLMAMPQARGLFRAAIIESGGIPNPTAPDDATRRARDLLAKLNVDPDDPARLQGLPFTSFIGHGSVGNPVADGRTLFAAPWGAGAPALSADIPLIVGNCQDEETFNISRTDPPDPFTLDWSAMPAKLAAMTKRSQDDLAPCIAAYRAVYPAESASDIFFRMISIAAKGRSGRLFADAKCRQPAPVYYYRMAYDTGIAPGLRAFHTSELPLATRMVAQPEAETLSKQIAGAWAAFARTGGDPNHPGLPRWNRYEPDGAGPLMIFDRSSRVGPDPEEKAQMMLRHVLV